LPSLSIDDSSPSGKAEVSKLNPWFAFICPLVVTLLGATAPLRLVSMSVCTWLSVKPSPPPPPEPPVVPVFPVVGPGWKPPAVAPPNMF